MPRALFRDEGKYDTMRGNYGRGMHVLANARTHYSSRSVRPRLERVRAMRFQACSVATSQNLHHAP